LVGQEYDFAEGFALGMEVAAGIAAETLDLAIGALGPGVIRKWMRRAWGYSKKAR